MPDVGPFDPEGGKRARDEGIARGRAHANEAWRVAWDAALLCTCRRLEYFTMDDVVLDLFRMGSKATTHDNRARGGAMLKARRDGLCELADGKEHRRSAQRVCHRRGMAVWRSKIYRGPGRTRA